MEFNKHWTIDDNDKLREFIKKGKSYDYIHDYFGNNKLFYHPTKKYYQSNKRQLIKDSFDNVKETIGESSFTNGSTAYYFEITNS